MGSEGASVDAERNKSSDAKPAVDDKRDGRAAAGAMPTGQSLGQRQLQKRAVVGGAGDEAERRADQAADHVMRMAEPGKPAESAPTAPPSPPAAAGAEPPVRRVADPATEQKVPGTPTVKPVGAGSAGGAGPDTATPAGPAPLVAPPIAAGAKPAESGTPAPDPEPPAPEGEPPARDTPAVPPQLQEYLDASRGKGAPLPEAVRKEFEAKFQRPFGDVRIHDDAGADDAARQIDAVAFTRGNDIYFRSGAYDPTTPAGKRLLAHELAHVVQQRPGVNRKAAPGLGGAVIRPAKAKPAKEVSVPDEQKVPKWKAPSGVKPAGEVDTTGKGMLVIEELPFPMWKAKTKSSLDAPYRWRHDKRGSTPQLANWKTAVRPKVQDETQKRLDAIPAAKPPGNDVYFAKLGKDATSEAKPQSTEFYIGTAKEIAEMLLVPTFDRSGTWAFYDVDHKVDWQISGRHAETVNEIGNLWLFNRKKNRDAGFPQAMRIRSCVDEFMDHADPYLTSKPSRKAVHSTYVTEFNKLIYSEAPDANDFEYWERPGIETGEYLKYLQPLTSGELTMVRGKPNEVQIFSRQGGGRVKSLAIDDQKKPIKKWEKKIRKSKKEVFEIQIVDFRKISDKGGTGNAGQVTGDVFRGSDVLTESDFVVGLEGIPGLPYAAYLSKSAIKLQMQAQGLSPVVVPDLEFDPFDGFIGRGKILPSAELLKSVDVNLVLDSTGIGVEALLAADSLALPGPFEVTGGSLALFAGTGGIGITGRLNFEIKKLAKGHVQAAAGNKNGAPKFELEGALDFDTKLFDQAHLDLWYRDEHWGVTGELGIEQPGKIKGIKRASAKVEVKDETVSATGEFEPSIKGIQKGSLAFTYDKTTGMEITGEILLGQGIPGIKSGKLAATIKEGPEKHSLSGDLSLEPSVPGVTGEVKGRYDDGMFLVDAQLGYEKGFAKGSVHLGVTNQPIGADGKPGGAPTPDGGVGVFGDGTVTLQLTPWLTGTVGLKLTPDGQVEVSGEVALPPVFTVFDETAITKELLSVHVDIPIIGVAVAGQRIGIFASIGGSVRVDAGVGPGQLRDMALKVTYNPAKPEATTVTGSAKFAVPAHAALRLSVDGSVGVGIPVVSAKAGLTVFGEIGVAGEASAGTAVTWTPTAGVVLDARGEISVEPKFKFGIDAFVDVSADLWLTTIEIYHETWKLKEFEYGSNLRFGLALPVHYESGKPFEISFDQIQWTYPKIEPKELISGLVKQVVGE